MYLRFPLRLLYGPAVQLKLFFHLPAISLHHNGNLLIAYLLATKFFPEHHTGKNISATIKEVLTSYEIPDSGVSSIVHDQGSNMR